MIHSSHSKEYTFELMCTVKLVRGLMVVQRMRVRHITCMKSLHAVALPLAHVTDIDCFQCQSDLYSYTLLLFTCCQVTLT